MEKILVSACLLGAKVRYHGGDAASDHPILHRWLAEGRLVVACPERDGGLPTPRPAAEIIGGDGRAVITRLARVVNSNGVDVTDAFQQGAAAALQLVQRHRIRLAVLKDGSPSCGSSSIYDGTFSGTRIDGRGVTAALLEAHGVRVFSDTAIESANAWLESLKERA